MAEAPARGVSLPIVAAAALVFFVVGAAAYGVANRLSLAGTIARTAVAAAGLGPARLSVEALDIDRAVIADLDVADGAIRARRIDVEFDLGGLLARRIESVGVDGLALALVWPPAPGSPFARLMGRDREAAPGAPAWTVEAVRLADAEIAVEAENGVAELAADGIARHLGAGRYRAEVDVDATLAPGFLSPLAVSGTVHATASPAGVEAASVRLTAERPPVPGIAVRRATLDADLDRDRLDARLVADTGGDTRIVLDATAPRPAAVSAETLVADVRLTATRPPVPFLAVLEAEIEARIADGAVELSGSIDAEEGRIVVAGAGPLPLGPAAAEGSWRTDLGFDLEGVWLPGLDGPLAIAGRAEARLGSDGLQVFVREPVAGTTDVGVPLRLRVEPQDRAVATLARPLAAGTPLALDVAAGEAVVAGVPLFVDGVAAEIEFGGEPMLTVHRARLVPGPDAPFAGAVDVSGTATFAEPTVAFAASLAAADGRLTLDVDGRHDLDTLRGQARLTMPDVTFAADGLQPADLAPAAAFVTDVVGRVGADGTVSWADDALASDLAVTLAGLAFAYGEVAVSGVDGTVVLDRPWPPRTPPGQEVAIGRVDAGLPMTGGRLRFHLADDGRLVLERAAIGVLGGRLAAADVVLDPASARHLAAVRIDGLDVETVLALAELDGAEASGRMSGTLPIEVSPDGISIPGGTLAAVGAGVLRYAPAVPPPALQGGGEGVSLMLEALKNFHYEALELSIDGRAGGEWVTVLHIAGKNPDFMDGYPFEFNLNVSGRLDEILRQGLRGYTLPERIGTGLGGEGR